MLHSHLHVLNFSNQTIRINKYAKELEQSDSSNSLKIGSQDFLLLYRVLFFKLDDLILSRVISSLNRLASLEEVLLASISKIIRIRQHCIFALGANIQSQSSF